MVPSRTETARRQADAALGRPEGGQAPGDPVAGSAASSAASGEGGPAGADVGLLSAPSVLGQAGSENFPVAMWVLRPDERRHLMAVYGFARLADDIGDEAAGDRLALLAWLDDQLERSVEGAADHPVLQEVGRSVRELGLPLEPFRDLVQANRQDQLVDRYETFDDLVAYCMLSAAPVGRLVLAVLGLASPERIALSDDVCVGLQLVEHLQDMGEDASRGRVYFPQEDLRRLGCDQDRLRAPSADDRLRRLVAYEAGRAHRLLGSGAALAATLPGRWRVAVCGFAAGGVAALDAIERARFDVLGHRCRPRPGRFAWRLAGTLVATVGRSDR